MILNRRLGVEVGFVVGAALDGGNLSVGCGVTDAPNSQNSTKDQNLKLLKQTTNSCKSR